MCIRPLGSVSCARSPTANGPRSTRARRLGAGGGFSSGGSEGSGTVGVYELSTVACSGPLGWDGPRSMPEAREHAVDVPVALQTRYSPAGRAVMASTSCSPREVGQQLFSSGAAAAQVPDGNPRPALRGYGAHRCSAPEADPCSRPSHRRPARGRRPLRPAACFGQRHVDGTGMARRVRGRSETARSRRCTAALEDRLARTTQR